MSLRRNTAFARGARGPTPIYKRRFVRFNTVVGPQANLNIDKITFRETGTVYAVKVDAKAQHISGAVGDIQNVELYCHITPSGTPQPASIRLYIKYLRNVKNDLTEHES